MIRSESEIYQEKLAEAVAASTAEGTRFFNHALSQRRKEVGLTRVELGQRVGMSTALISHYESLSKFPTPELARKLAGVLGLEPQVLFPEWLKMFIKDRNKVVPETDELSIESLRLSLHPQTEMEVSDLEERVRHALDHLSFRERRVLELRFGIGDEEEKTLEEVGMRFSVTKERIRQIEGKAFLKLRRRPFARGLVGLIDIKGNPNQRTSLMNGVVNALHSKNYARAEANLQELEKMTTAELSGYNSELVEALGQYKGAYKWDRQLVREFITWFIKDRGISGAQLNLKKIFAATRELREVWKLKSRIPGTD